MLRPLSCHHSCFNIFGFFNQPPHKSSLLNDSLKQACNATVWPICFTALTAIVWANFDLSRKDIGVNVGLVLLHWTSHGTNVTGLMC